LYKGHGGLSGDEIGGIVGGVLGAVLISAVVLLYCQRKKQHSKMESQAIAPSISEIYNPKKTQIGGKLHPGDSVEMDGRIKDSEIEDMEQPGGRLAKILQIHSASAKGL
jgi:hypothetical protein